MSNRRGAVKRRRPADVPAQFPLPASPAAKPPRAATRASSMSLEQRAKDYLAKKATPSVVPGHVKLLLTLELTQEVAERLGARAIREGKSLEAVITDVLGAAGIPPTNEGGREAR